MHAETIQFQTSIGISPKLFYWLEHSPCVQEVLGSITMGFKKDTITGTRTPKTGCSTKDYFIYRSNLTQLASFQMCVSKKSVNKFCYY